VRNNHVGVYRPSTGTFFLRGARPGWNEAVADASFPYGDPNWRPLLGDWDGNGTQTVGVFNPGTLTFHLRNSNTAGTSDVNIVFGATGDVPVAGDWDGNGTDTLGVWRPSTATFYLRNSNTPGTGELVFPFGATGDIPVAGDWNGDGVTTIGVYRPGNSTFYLRNSNNAGPNDLTIPLGNPGGGDKPVVGDWNGDGVTTVGVWRNSTDVFYLIGEDLARVNTLVVAYGAPGDVPLSGNWGSSHPGYDTVMPSLANFFPLAVDFQHSSSFSKWVSRGMNTVIRVPFNIEPLDTVANWTAKANELGLKMIREPANPYTLDNTQPNLLAIDLHDEPDLTLRDGAADLRRQYDALKAVNPRPVFTNFAGGEVLFPSLCDGLADSVPDGTCYPGFLSFQDVVSNDTYPVGFEGGQLGRLGDALDKLRRWKPGVSQFAYIEAADFDGNGSVPSAGQFRAQIWSAIVHGARGLFFFTARADVAPKTQDAMPAELVTEFGVQAPRIKNLAAVLQSAINPPAYGATVGRPLEVGWRSYGGNVYFIVVNLTGSTLTRSITLRGVNFATTGLTVMFENRTIGQGATNGVITDTFEPYQVHIYRL
jgi:hypothetical protein